MFCSPEYPGLDILPSPSRPKFWVLRLFFLLNFVCKKQVSRIKFWIFFFLLSQCSASFAQQNNNYFFRHIDQQDGLAHNNVYDITQDHKGFIWIVTSAGLQRYDGSRFLIIPDMISDPGEIITEGATLYADNKNNILWISKAAKLEKLELANRRLTVYEPGQLLKDNPGLFRQYTSEQNETRLLADNALYDYNNSTRKFELAGFNIRPAMGNTSSSFAKDNITGGTLMTAFTNGLLLFDPQTKKIYTQNYNPLRHPILEAFRNKFGKIIPSLKDILQDSNENTWTSTWSDILYRYNQTTHKIYTYSITSILQSKTGKKNNPPVAVHCLYKDNHGTIWVSTENAGLLKFNKEKDEFEIISIDEKDKTGRRYNYKIYSIFQDREENIWLATDKGVSIFNPYRQYFHSIQHQEDNIASLPKSEINALIQTKSGDILAGTWGGGITLFDSLWNFKKTITFSGTAEQNLIWDFVQTDDGNIWAGCQHGYIHIYNPSNQSIQTIHPPELNNYTIRCMTKDPKGNIWLGLHNGKIARWDKSQNKFESFPSGSQFENGLINPVQYIFIDKQERCWVSTVYGLKKFDAATKTYTEYYQPDMNNPASIRGRTIQGIEQYNDTTLVIGTVNGGINFFNTNAKTFSHLNTEDGLPSNTIYTIKKDIKDFLWFTTDYGLFKFMPPGKKIIRYNIEPGVLNSSFKLPGFYVLKNGNWITATTTEIISFNPENSGYDNRSATKVEITGFKIFETSFFIDSLLATNKPVELTYIQNFFTIEFAALNFSNLHQNKYYYQLSGVNKDWVNADIKPSAGYTNLQPGEYTFSVKADSENGTTEINSFKIIISPPFWKTWWFKALLLLLAGGGIFWLLKRRIRFIRHNAEMKQKIAETEMMALRAQMNPHFIFNCLNSIDNLIQTNEKEKATLYLSKFAKLIRSILETSKNNTVPCWKDMETLTLYLELEELRWDKKISYEITIADEIQNGDYKVPPLIIQPFVENAIHHGLLNKTGSDRKLKIDVSVSNNYIRYCIQDNGVGRAKAALYTQLNRPSHESMGMQITTNRINLFNHNKNGSVKITDLYIEQQPAGTKVEVELINQ
ncbi:MAG: two-component regulator propeller domain-containing protein [Chitinophagaceae bacterium]